MATPLNEATQRRIDAQADLRSLETERDAKRAQLRTLLKAASGADEKGAAEASKQATDIEALATSLDGRIAAARKLVTIAEQDEAEERVKSESKKIAASDDGIPRVAVVEDKGDKLKKDPKHGFSSPREFLFHAIKESGLRDRVQVQDERLRVLAVTDQTDKMAAGELAFMLPEAFTPGHLRGGPMATAGSDEQGGYDNRYGGFASGRTMLPGVLQINFEGDPTMGRTQAVPMATPMVDMLARTDKDHTTSVSGGFTVTRKPETASASSSRGAVEVVSLKATSLFGLAYATEEILQDSVVSFLAIIEAGFRDQFGAYMLNEKLRGAGGGEYLGVLTALASSSLGPTVSVAKETGQAADTIVTDNITKMAARCWGFGNSVWLANHEARPQLYTLKVEVGTGGVLLYQPSRGEGFPDMLLGRPVYYTEYASALGDVGDIILGNWSQYLEGLYQPLQSAESIHVRFVNHERTFKFWLRNAGAPWWKSALTPNKGASTLSPFVTLAAR
jgi:HK97 family phage major capsid protein